MPPRSSAQRPGTRPRTAPKKRAPDASGFEDASDEFEDIESPINQGETLRPRSIRAEEPPRPHFPELMMMLGVASDMLDMLDFSIFLSVFTSIASMPVSAALVMWFLAQSTEGNGVALQRGGFRLAIIAIAEMIPFVQILPLNAYFIWWVHNERMKKHRRMVDQTIEVR